MDATESPLTAARKRAIARERERLIALIEEHGGRVSCVAAALGVSRYAAYRALDRHGLRAPSSEAAQ